MAIKNEAFTIVGGLDDFDFLVGGLFGSVNLGDSPHMRLIGGVKLNVPMGADQVGHHSFSLSLDR